MPDTNMNDIGIKVTTEGVETATKGLESLVSVLDKLKNTTGNMSSVSATINETTTSISGLGKVLKAGFNIAGLIAVFKSLKSAVGSAVNYGEQMNLFRESLGDYTKQAYDFAQRVQEVMGVDSAQWMNAQGTIMNLANGFGIASDRAYVMSQQLTQVAYDLASFQNVDADVALEKVRAGFAGQIEPLRNWGYDLSKARLQLYATELGITKTVSSMTQAEKSQLRYYAIMKQLPQVQGDMARTLNEPANQLRILSAQFQLAARAVGSIFVPALRLILPVAIAVVRAIRFIMESIAAFFGYELPDLNAKSITDTTGAVADDLDKANGSAKKLKKQLAGFDEINNLITPDPSGSGKSSAGGGWVDFELPTYDFLGDAVEKQIDGVYEKIKKFLPILAAIGAAIATFSLVKKIESLGKTLSALWGVIMANPITAIIAVIVGALVYLYTTSEEFRNGFNNFVATIMEGLRIIWNDYLVPLFNNIIKPLVIGTINVLWNLLKLFGAFLVGVFSASIAAVQVVISTLAGVFTTAWGIIKSTLVAFRDTGANIINTIKGVFSGLITFITGVFSGDWKKAWSGVVQIFSSVFQGIKNAFKIPINWVIDGINAFIRGLNRIKIPNWVPVVGGKGFSIGTIPRLATGGIITEPTTALIGEAGPEMVLPLKNNTEWMDVMAAKVAVNNDGSNEETVDVLRAIFDVVSNMELKPVVDIQDMTEAVNNRNNARLRIQGV